MIGSFSPRHLPPWPWRWVKGVVVAPAKHGKAPTSDAFCSYAQEKKTPGVGALHDQRDDLVYCNVNFMVCTSRLLGPTMTSKSPGSFLYSNCWL